MFIHKPGRNGLMELKHLKDAESQFQALDSYLRFFFDDVHFLWISKYFNELIKYSDIDNALYMEDINTPRPFDPNDDFNFVFSGLVEFNYK